MARFLVCVAAACVLMTYGTLSSDNGWLPAICGYVAGLLAGGAAVWWYMTMEGGKK